MTVTRAPKLRRRCEIARIEPVVTHGFCLQPESARLIYAGDRIRLEPNRTHGGHDVGFHYNVSTTLEQRAPAFRRGHGVEHALQGEGVYPAATDISARGLSAVLADEMIRRLHLAGHHHRLRVRLSALGPDVLGGDKGASDGLRLGEGGDVGMNLIPRLDF